MNDSTFRLIVRLKAQGYSWAEVSARVNVPVDELEDVPWQDPARWREAMTFAEEVQRQEIAAEALRTLRTTLAKTTEARLQVQLANTLVRLLDQQRKATVVPPAKPAPQSPPRFDGTLPPLPKLSPLPELRPLPPLHGRDPKHPPPVERATPIDRTNVPQGAIPCART